MTDMHVLPMSDAVGHEVDDDCVCGPRMDPVKRADGSMGWVAVHHLLAERQPDIW